MSKRKLTLSLKFILPAIAILLILAAIMVVYWRAPKIFFQQDEWISYGLYLTQGFRYIFSNVHGGFSFILGEGRVFQSFIFYMFLKLFGLNTAPFLTFMLVVHMVNSVLVFLLGLKIFKKIFPSLLSSLFFALNSLSMNSVTWPATAGVLISTTLIIISIFAFIRFIEEEKKKWLILTFISLYLSLFFKEMGIYLFLYLPFISLIYKKSNIKKFLITYWPFLLFSVVDGAYRVLELKSISGPNALFLTGTSNMYWLTLLSRIVFYPITSFSLVFVPPEPFLWIARYFALVYYPFLPAPQFILIAQTAVLDLLAVTLSFTIFILISRLLKYSSKDESRNIKYFAGLLFFSYLPYVIISKNFSYLESRYYYLPSIAAGIIVGWLVYKLTQKIRASVLKPIPIIVFFIFIGFHIKYLQISINKEVAISTERRGFLRQLNIFVPNLKKDKNIFYFTSDTDYYIPGNKVPFQNGLGFTLMGLYYGSGKIPAEFIKQEFLFDIRANDYKEINGKGFGYFSDLSKLTETLKKYKLDKSSVYVFYYNSKNEDLNLIDNFLKN